MTIRKLGIDTHRGHKDRLVLAFWIYFLLLIFEGALRKWIFPDFSNIFLVARDPIAIYALMMGFKYHLVKNKFCWFFIVMSLITFITTITIEHGNLFVALYGFRIYGINAPALFIWASVLTLSDIRKVAKAVLFLLILTTIIIVIQYVSPQDAWINIGTGGDEDGSGFQGIGDYFRPSGTFSFTSGLAAFEFLCCACLFYFISEAYRLNISYTLLVIFIVTYILSIFFSLSRTIVAQTAMLMGVFMIASLTKRKRLVRTILILVITALVTYISYHEFPIFRIAYNNMFIRFDQASYAEGSFIKDSIGERYFGSFIRAFTDTQNFTGLPIPNYGFGMGSGSRVGTILLGLDVSESFGVAEEEWSLTICENGYLFGGLILIIGRTLFPLTLLFKSIFKSKCRDNSFNLYLSATFLIISMATQLSVPTHLGFYTVIGALTLGSLLQNKERPSIRYDY